MALHFLQPDYDPSHQLMSELSLGSHGWAMLVAFTFLALAVSACLAGLRHMGASIGIQILLLVCTTSFLGAGIFPLGVASELHISLVAAAFIAMVLVMYLLPSETLNGCKMFRLPSWTLAGSTALSVLLGENVLPMGIAQRIAAASIVLWLIWVSFLMWKCSRR
ncbi:membrane hypothetical protein [Gammaproteobacteria bacterium]